MNTKIETEAKIKLQNNSFEKIIGILGCPHFIAQKMISFGTHIKRY